MSVRVEFSVPASACALGRSLGDNPELSIELDRIVPTDSTIMPFFWLWGPDVESFCAAAREEPAIETLTIIDEVDNGALFRARWDPDAVGTLRSITDTDGVLLDARADTTGWAFEVRFADSEQTSRFRELCAKRDVPIQVTRVRTGAERPTHDGYRLTDEQSEALAAAYRLGFFTEPRSATLEELADELGISPRAVAGRLRRGQATLLEETGLAEVAAVQ